MTYRQGVYNEDGEPLGIETIYEDPPDPDEWYEQRERREDEPLFSDPDEWDEWHWKNTD